MATRDQRMQARLRAAAEGRQKSGARQVPHAIRMQRLAVELPMTSIYAVVLPIENSQVHYTADSCVRLRTTDALLEDRRTLKRRQVMAKAQRLGGKAQAVYLVYASLGEGRDAERIRRVLEAAPTYINDGADAWWFVDEALDVLLVTDGELATRLAEALNLPSFDQLPGYGPLVTTGSH